MRDYDRLLDQIEQFINKYNQIESSSRDYGAGVLLSRTEIHLIAAIGDNPGIGVNKLAVLKGVSDGAVSQMIRKLVQKNLVNKAISKGIKKGSFLSCPGEGGQNWVNVTA